MPPSHRPARSVRLLLAEDPRTSHGGLALLLEMHPDLKVVTQVSSGEEVLDAVLTRRPDVALLDVDLPGRGGPELAAELTAQAPDCRVVLLATAGRPEYMRRALAAGAAGFLVKDGPVDDLAAAVRRVLTGETVVDPALAAVLRGEPG
jgi:two-component system response regulator DesR